MPLLPKAGIARIKPHMKPADTQAGAPWALLHSNENAFGPSPHAIAAAREAVEGLERYFEAPDRALAPAIAARYDLDPACITVGQGSDDLIARLARAYLTPGTHLMRSVNGYQKVPNYAYGNDADVISVPDDGFVPSVDAMIAAMTDTVRIVYLANPENPAGTYLSGAEIRRLHAAMPDHALMLLDCAYQDYVDAPDYEAGEALARDLPRVVVCRTFSKIYGLAGARVGWCSGPADVIDAVRRIGLTFPIATPSAAAALAALDDQDHVATVRRETLRNRASLTAALTELGLRVIPSQTNFLLVECPDPARPAPAIEAHLRQDGILVRRLAAAAFDRYIRITLGTQDELDGLMTSLRQYFSAS